MIIWLFFLFCFSVEGGGGLFFCVWCTKFEIPKKIDRYITVGRERKRNRGRDGAIERGEVSNV